MKYLQLVAFLILITSCCGTKGINETTTNETPKTVKAIDPIIKNTKPLETIEPVSEKTEIVETNIPEVKENTKGFNQILTKQSIEVHNLWNKLLIKHVSSDGIVNYKSFKSEHKKLLDYIYVLSLIHSDKNFKSLSRENKLAYWINAYNAMTIDLILRHYPIKSIKDIKNPWDQRFWKLGDKWYNLSEIEHEILRKMNEPRIHFAIVCASFSCPKLQNEAFVSENIENQLTNVTKEFLSDSNRNEISENSIKLSKIFQWFSKDFKQDGDLIDFLNKYTDITISAKAKKSFKDYNWDLNE